MQCKACALRVLPDPCPSRGFVVVRITIGDDCGPQDLAGDGRGEVRDVKLRPAVTDCIGHGQGLVVDLHFVLHAHDRCRRIALDGPVVFDRQLNADRPGMGEPDISGHLQLSDVQVDGWTRNHLDGHRCRRTAAEAILDGVIEGVGPGEARARRVGDRPVGIDGRCAVGLERGRGSKGVGDN